MAICKIYREKRHPDFFYHRFPSVTLFLYTEYYRSVFFVEGYALAIMTAVIKNRTKVSAQIGQRLGNHNDRWNQGHSVLLTL